MTAFLLLLSLVLAVIGVRAMRRGNHEGDKGLGSLLAGAVVTLMAMVLAAVCALHWLHH